MLPCMIMPFAMRDFPVLNSLVGGAEFRMDALISLSTNCQSNSVPREFKDACAYHTHLHFYLQRVMICKIQHNLFGG